MVGAGSGISDGQCMQRKRKVHSVFGISSTMHSNPLPRLDSDPELEKQLLSFCRLRPGEIWTDDVQGHRVGCLDAADAKNVGKIMLDESAQLAIHDPPYNLIAFKTKSIYDYLRWCRKWVMNSNAALSADASLYVWLGADQRREFQPFADFIIMMREMPFQAKSMITLRNQRGYGTQKNWMAIRQELLYYVKGNPRFNVEAEYTDIPKILRGYYKKVDGKVTENFERGRSDTIRAGNVWVDIQQVFYRMEENVSGCYAQKPIKCIDRIIRASSYEGDLVIDFFAHSGTTLLASEISNRRCFTLDINPVFAEITIRRLEHYRRTGQLGWQNGHPFEAELGEDEANLISLDNN